MANAKTATGAHDVSYRLALNTDSYFHALRMRRELKRMLRGEGFRKHWLSNRYTRPGEMLTHKTVMPLYGGDKFTFCLMLRSGRAQSQALGLLQEICIRVAKDGNGFSISDDAIG